MEENEMKNEKEDLFSKAVRAGKRTYFFDVKTTKSDEKYLTITESKRRFDNDQNRFFFEKHKIFLYKVLKTNLMKLCLNLLIEKEKFLNFVMD